MLSLHKGYYTVKSSNEDRYLARSSFCIFVFRCKICHTGYGVWKERNWFHSIVYGRPKEIF